MFERARRRLALRYLILMVVIVAAFSIVLWVALAIVLQPAFDVVPELPSDQASIHAYNQAIKRIALAIAIADVVVVVIIGGLAYYLAGRTLRPIEQAHARQRRFVADASHEMRNPLAAIRATAESALTPAADDAAREVALRSIVTSSERLSDLTDDLLLLARSEQGVLRQQPERLDLSVVVAEAVEGFRRSAGDETTIGLSLAPDLAVEADASDVSRIVTNLVDNALRYGRGPGGIAVRTLAVDGFARAEVVDHGPGIPAADLPRIFDPFYRVRSDAGAPVGNGLGLAIASDLARRNGARLSVTSHPGVETVFRLQLPRAR